VKTEFEVPCIWRDLAIDFVAKARCALVCVLTRNEAGNVS
jgi:hypothetical protein